MSLRNLYYKNWPPSIPKHIEIPDVSLPEILRKTAKQFPDAVATTYLGSQMTYKVLDKVADKIAGVLMDLGLKQGETVALHFTNVPPCVASYYGVLRAGGRVTMLSPLFKGLEIKYQLKDSDAKILICWEGFDQMDEPVVAETFVDTIIHSNLGPWFMPDPTVTGERISQDPNRLYLEDLVRDFELGDRVFPAIDPRRDIACLQYTGGTTGIPKGAMLTHYNLVANIYQMRAIFEEAEPGKEVMLIALPLYHIYAQNCAMNLSVLLGGNMVLMMNPRETGELVEAIKEYKVTIFPGVAALYNNINNFEGIENMDLSSIKYCISGAGPLPKEIQDKFESLTGAKLREGYGLTEASPVTHANPLAGRFKNGTIGLPLPDTDMRIVDVISGKDITDPNVEGELWIKGPQVMKGYYNRDSSESLEAGWLKTGDIALIDEDGYTVIKDRLKNMIKYKGHSVYPAEIENYLFENEAILDCAVIGVPDETVGENIKAFVVLKSGFEGKISENDIITWAKNHIGFDKYPRIVEFVDEIPKSFIGKTLHRLLRERKDAKDSSR
ncbi:MAG: long-chain-fatty-acid--CoA ligase [Promethearchaeota archaeon]